MIWGEVEDDPVLTGGAQGSVSERKKKKKKGGAREMGWCWAAGSRGGNGPSPFRCGAGSAGSSTLFFLFKLFPFFKTANYKQLLK